MTCRVGNGYAVCGPPPGVYRRVIAHCPICERRRRHVIRWDGAWYGQTVYCACGDRWTDGGLAPRPFERGWRQRAQQDFRAMWDNAAPRHLYDAYVDADVRFAVADGDEWERACDDRGAAQAAIDAKRGAA